MITKFLSKVANIAERPHVKIFCKLNLFSYKRAFYFEKIMTSCKGYTLRHNMAEKNINNTQYHVSMLT